MSNMNEYQRALWEGRAWSSRMQEEIAARFPVEGINMLPPFPPLPLVAINGEECWSQEQMEKFGVDLARNIQEFLDEKFTKFVGVKMEILECPHTELPQPTHIVGLNRWFNTEAMFGYMKHVWVSYAESGARVMKMSLDTLGWLPTQEVEAK